MRHWMSLSVILAAILLPMTALASGTVSIARTATIDAGKTKIVTITWLADAETATVPSTAFPSSVMAEIEGYYLVGAEADPGTVPPTVDYDITITDAHGLDVMGGNLENLSATLSQYRIPKVDAQNSLFGARPITSPLTFQLSGNSENSATGVVVLTFIKD